MRERRVFALFSFRDEARSAESRSLNGPPGMMTPSQNGSYREPTMNHTRTSLTLAILVTLGLSAPAMAQSADRSTSQNAAADSDQPGTDTWITTKVKADLLASGKTSGTDISVETTNGVVWLSGTVATQAEKDQAVTEAKGIEGVKKVDASKLKVANKM